MIDHLIVGFYRFWHGVLHFKGAGRMLSLSAHFMSGLQKYKLRLTEQHAIEVDFRDVSGIYWLNHLLGDAYEERGLLVALSRHLDADDVFWDIGANCGLLSYKLATLCNLAEIHMFEPNPNMSGIASDAMSPFAHAKVHNFGISSSTDSFVMTVPKGHTTMGTLEPDATNRHGSTFHVDCRFGDDLVFKNGFTPPTVIKMDTEGHELKVMEGLSRTISEYLPIIYFEHISIDQRRIVEFSAGRYDLFTISDHTGELLPGIQPDAGHNAALIPVTKSMHGNGFNR